MAPTATDAPVSKKTGPGTTNTRGRGPQCNQRSQNVKPGDFRDQVPQVSTMWSGRCYCDIPEPQFSHWQTGNKIIALTLVGCGEESMEKAMEGPRRHKFLLFPPLLCHINDGLI